jgi:hypothetical protein
MEYYRHSGRFSLSGLLFFAISLFVFALMGGALYCAAVVFVPFIKLRAIIAVFFAIGWGTTIGTGKPSQSAFGVERGVSGHVVGVLRLLGAASFVCLYD